MPRMIVRRAVGVAALALLLIAGAATAAAPPGPRLAVIKLSANPPRYELVNVNQRGGDPLRLAGGGAKARPLIEYLFSPISWAADGETVVFSGILGFQGGDDHEPIRRAFTVGADGTGLRPIRGTNGAIGPIFSPDGRTVAFTRSVDRETPTTVGGKPRKEFHGSSIWAVDLQTGAQRQLTPWLDGVHYAASSFSPDGSMLLAERDDPRLVIETQPVAIKLDGSGLRPVFDDGFSPVYSPDGSKIALIRRTTRYGDDEGEDSDLFVVDADGTGIRRLTRTPGLVELSPSWDPSGQRLAYIRLPKARVDESPFGFSTGLMQVNADGTCQTKVVSRRRTFFFEPTWQPGPGREAGRIEC